MSEFRLKGQFTEDASSLDSLDVLRYRRPTTLLPSEISELQIKRSGVFIFKLELTRVTSREVAVSVHRAPRGDAERFVIDAIRSTSSSSGRKSGHLSCILFEPTARDCSLRMFVRVSVGRTVKNEVSRSYLTAWLPLWCTGPLKISLCPQPPVRWSQQRAPACLHDSAVSLIFVNAH